MGTRGVIARVTPEGFAGRYHHWDSYPSGLGATLFELYRGHFNRDIGAMLKFLIDDHPAGWSTINNKDFTQPAGFGENGFKATGPECYCHGGRHETGYLYTNVSAADSGCEWVYVLDEAKRELIILSSFCDPADPRVGGQKMIGFFGAGDPNAVWIPVARIPLDAAAEPDWDEINERDALPAAERG